MAGPTVVPMDTITPAVQEMIDTGEASIGAMRSIANQCEAMVTGPALNTNAGRAVLAKVQEVRAIADRLNQQANEKAGTMNRFGQSSGELQASQASMAQSIPTPSGVGA